MPGRPPFTAAERNYLHSEFARFKHTGFGINPNQSALKHNKEGRCGCHWCSGTEITYTREMIPAQNFRRIDNSVRSQPKSTRDK